MKKIFISHSHSDKHIARTTARYLRAYGIDPWLDERELRLGDRLDDALQQHIRASSVIAVLATSASASSKWVTMEIEFANKSNPPIPICPIFLESLQTHPLFGDYLGLDATNPHDFSLVVERLAEALLGSPLPSLAIDIIEEDLKTLAVSDRRLDMLIKACRSDMGGAYFEHQRTIGEASFFELDYALNALSYVIQPESRLDTAYSTAEFFAMTGAGSCALRRYFNTEKEVGSIARIAFYTELRTEELHVAINFLSEFDPPEDEVLRQFIRGNAVQLQENYEREIVRLVTWPPRGPATLADAGASALRLWPENHDLMTLWNRWVWQGLFDGTSGGEGHTGPSVLAHYVAKGLEEGRSEWAHIFESTVTHLRGLARAASAKKVACAYKYFMELETRKCQGLDRVMAELENACFSGEWEDWGEKTEWRARIAAVTDAARKGNSVLDAAYKVELKLKSGSR